MRTLVWTLALPYPPSHNDACKKKKIELCVTGSFTSFPVYVLAAFDKRKLQKCSIVLPSQKVQLGLSFVGSIQKLSQGHHLCYGSGIDIMKPWEAKNSKFPNLLWITRHLKSADFSMLEFQVLITKTDTKIIFRAIVIILT